MFELLQFLAVLITRTSHACVVLDALDENRAFAYAYSAPAMLADMYETPAIARADVKLLSRYQERRIRVVDLEMERNDCTVKDDGTIHVTERLQRAEVLLADGSRRVLPAGQWQQLRVKVTFDERWRIAETEPVGQRASR